MEVGVIRVGGFASAGIRSCASELIVGVSRLHVDSVWIMRTFVRMRGSGFFPTHL